MEVVGEEVLGKTGQSWSPLATGLVGVSPSESEGWSKLVGS